MDLEWGHSHGPLIFLSQLVLKRTQTQYTPSTVVSDQRLLPSWATIDRRLSMHRPLSPAPNPTPLAPPPLLYPAATAAAAPQATASQVDDAAVLS